MSETVSVPVWVIGVSIIAMGAAAGIFLDLSMALNRQCRLNLTLLDRLELFHEEWMVPKPPEGAER